MAKILLPRAHYHSLVDSFLMSASHSCNVYLEFYVHDGIISTRFSDSNKPVAALQAANNNSSSNVLNNKIHPPSADSVDNLNAITPFKRRRLVDEDLQQEKRIQQDGEKLPEEPPLTNCVKPTRPTSNASDSPSKGSKEDTEKRSDSANSKQIELSAKSRESTSASSSTCNLLRPPQIEIDPLNPVNSDAKLNTCKKDFICLACFKNIRNFMCSKCCGNICNGGFSCAEVNDHAKGKCPICNTVIVINSFLSII